MSQIWQYIELSPWMTPEHMQRAQLAHDVQFPAVLPSNLPMSLIEACLCCNTLLQCLHQISKINNAINDAIIAVLSPAEFKQLLSCKHVTATQLTYVLHAMQGTGAA